MTEYNLEDVQEIYINTKGTRNLQSTYALIATEADSVSEQYLGVKRARYLA